MTEEQIKKEESVTETPEMEKAPKGAKRSPWIAIVSLIVAIALIATAVMVLFAPPVGPTGPVLSVWTSPSQISVDKGMKVRIIGYAVFKNNSQDPGTNMSTNVADLIQTAAWEGTSLGTLTRGLTDNKEVSYLFESKTVGTSTIKWTFKYTDANNTPYTNTTRISVTVGPATLNYVEITPASAVLFKETTMNFTAQAFMTDGTMPSGVTYAWSLDNPSVGTISQDTGNQTMLTAANVSEYVRGNLTCTATLSGKSVTGIVDILVIHMPPPSSTISKFYDIFNVSMKDYWGQRNDTSWYSTEFPYREIWSGSPAGNVWMYGNCRMNITARNISNTNTLHIGGKPWYVPVFGNVKGGTIEIDWYADYLTQAQAIAEGYPENILGWFDGWFWKWWGTITMDKTAAKMVIGMTNADFDDFATWKLNDFPAFKSAFSKWLADEANRFGIYFCYEYPYNALYEAYDIEKVGDKIVFHIVNHLSWGMESLMGRWWSYTFLPYEYWPEDVHFKGTIGPMWSNFDLTMAMQYNFYAWNSTKEGRPSWIFEVVHADALYGSNAYYESQLNEYLNNPDDKTWGYWCRIVGNAKYGQLNAYDYTPWYWNLGPNDKIIIEWPKRPVIGYQHVGTNDYTHVITGNMTPRWIEPLPPEAPGVVNIDMKNRTITFTGPFDMYNWSKNTINARELHENWTRISNPPKLPHGVPWVEFVVNTDAEQKPIATIGGRQIVTKGIPWTWNGSGSWDVDGSIVSYTWNWGDGSPVTTGPIGTHTYNPTQSSYNYTITLTVTDNDGLSNTEKLRVNVVDNIPPIAKFSAPGIGYLGKPIIFNASQSEDIDNNITSYEWDFGDGNTATGMVVTHTYNEPMKVFNVTLTVTDDNPRGAKSTSITKKISILGSFGLPIAKMYVPRVVRVNQPIQLTGEMSYPVSGSTISNYAWNFGDSSTGSGMTVTHTWTAPGIYNVSLTVTDNHSNVSVPDIRSIVVVSASATGIGVSLAKHALKPNEMTTITVSVVDGAGNVVSSFNGQVDITANNSGYNGPSVLTLTSGTGTTTVSFSTAGAYNITVTNATLGISGYEFASVADRTVEFVIYDIMEYPLGNWWDRRKEYYSLMDEPYRNTTPVVEIYRPGQLTTEAQLTTTYRMRIIGEDIPEIRTANPTFIPRMNKAAGDMGKVSYHLEWQYMSYEDLADAIASGKIDAGQANAYDGWEIYLVGNLTLDRTAAAHIIGLPISEPNVQAWFAARQAEDYFKNKWMTWWTNESGYSKTGYVGRLDIRASDDGYQIDAGYWNSSFESLTENPDGTVTLNFWRIGYGEDILIMRQLYWGGESYGNVYPNGTPYGILPFECWLEDFEMDLNLTESAADVNITCAVAYGWRAWRSDTAPAGVAAWRWENIRSDYMAVTETMPKSEMAVYSDRELKYLSWDPGSAAFGKQISYDYTPNVWNMTLGEVLIIERPKPPKAVGYLPYPMLGNYSQLAKALEAGYYDSLRLIEKWGDATLHPIGCPPGTAIIDAATGDLKIAGPFEPIKIMTPGIPWLLYEPAPRIEIWVT
ncbi:MAG: PKD domain-containing protein [Thermoplasmata archaeon]